jgi:hypothetical protein
MSQNLLLFIFTFLVNAVVFGIAFSVVSMVITERGNRGAFVTINPSLTGFLLLGTIFGLPQALITSLLLLYLKPASFLDTALLSYLAALFLFYTPGLLLLPWAISADRESAKDIVSGRRWVIKIIYFLLSMSAVFLLPAFITGLLLEKIAGLFLQSN